MTRIRSFPPIENSAARTLILGTMPGAASLRAAQYYAHPRNGYWTILAGVLGFDARLDYAARSQCLVRAGIAVWDVLQSCERAGSLDARIAPASIVANDFRGFFVRHPHIERVCFNGASAEALFRRHVVGTLVDATHLTYVRLPSTSPANASISMSAKADAWRIGLAAHATPAATQLPGESLRY